MATYNDYPQSATNNAKKVLAWKEKYGDEVKGMTSIGWTRARQLASRRKLSYETIARMAAFNRHRKNAEIDPKFKDTPWKDRGYVAWLGWGGTSGVNWAIKKAESIRKGTAKLNTDIGDFPWGDRKKNDDYATQGKDGSIKKSPKAPKSDTPNKNPKGVGKGGKLSPKIIKSIETKVAKHNEKYPDKKVGVGAAKRVVLRGMGAFNTSHSPKVTSATQWGLARLNAFLYLVKNGKPSNPKYVQDNDLLPSWHKRSKKGKYSDKEMIDGIVDILIEIKDKDNRLALARKQIEILKKEVKDFDEKDFLRRIGL